MINRLFLFFVLLPVLALGEKRVASILPALGEPSRQFAIIREGGTEQFLRADISRKPSVFEVSVVLPRDEFDGLVSFGYVTNEGSVYTTPLTSLSKKTGNGSDNDTLSELKTRKKDLEIKIEKANAELFRKAGLDEISDIYKKIEKIEMEMRNEEK